MLFRSVKKKGALEKAEAERYACSGRLYELENAVKADDRALSASIPVRIACEKHLAALDFGPRLNGGAMARDVKAREYNGATGRVRNILSFNNLDLTVVFDTDPGDSEIVIDLFRDKTGIGVALPESATLIKEATA